MGIDNQTLLASLRPAVSGAGAALPLAGGIVESRAARATGEAAARASEFNARLERERGTLAARQIRREGGRTIGQARRQIAQSGVALEGTPMQFLLDQALEVEQAAFQAQLAARRSAALDAARAQEEREAGRRQGVAALLSGGARSVGTGLRLQREGALF